MGFVTLGTVIGLALVRATGNKDAAYLGVSGAMVQMISHGFVSGAMFSCVGVVYDRLHSRMIKDYGGVVNTMPWVAAFLVLFAMASWRLPGLSGFLAVVMGTHAACQSTFWLSVLAAVPLLRG